MKHFECLFDPIEFMTSRPQLTRRKKENERESRESTKEKYWSQHRPHQRGGVTNSFKRNYFKETTIFSIKKLINIAHDDVCMRWFFVRGIRLLWSYFCKKFPLEACTHDFMAFIERFFFLEVTVPHRKLSQANIFVRAKEHS